MLQAMVEVDATILPIYGREMAFSEKDLIAIVEEHFAHKDRQKFNLIDIAITPSDGKCFEVNPATIDQTIFHQARADRKEEWTRKIILEAFEAVAKYPEKYAKGFYTFIPIKRWKYKTIEELEEMARILGDHMADWVEQSLEWAQRIANGEEWKTVCNYPDTANWSRIVMWENNNAKIVGGSREECNDSPATGISTSYSNSRLLSGVPLVILYK